MPVIVILLLKVMQSCSKEGNRMIREITEEEENKWM
jgi:hypothetical protein